MKQKLAIFDFDGTLYDTAPANTAAYLHALARYGVTADPEEFAEKCSGRYYKTFLPALMQTDDSEKIEAVHQEKMRCYPDFYGMIRENTALFDLLAALSPSYHIALVSTASRKSILDILRQFHRTEAFDSIFAQEDIPRKKPAPDGFLLAMQHFHVTPENTVIFEDSEEGIAAAKACGAAYLRVDEILSAER